MWSARCSSALARTLLQHLDMNVEPTPLPPVPSSSSTQALRRTMHNAHRRTRFIGLLLGALMLAACGKLLFFRLRRDLVETRVQGSPVGGLLGDVPLDIPLDFDLEAEIAERKTGPIQGVYLESLRIDLTDTAQPPGDVDDLSFIERIDVYIECTSACGLPRVLIASAESIGEGETTARFQTFGVDLQDYIDAGARIVTNGSGNVPEDDVTFDGRMTIRVEVL